ncbi:MAG: HEAT repeat domain-containing protein [Pirellulaceae bacterium]|nr:HEAT repeat domain-containing protein [Pirellulaceae bacterium]
MRNRTLLVLAGKLAILLSIGGGGSAAAGRVQAGEQSLGDLIGKLQSPDGLAERLQAAEAIAEYGSAAVPPLLPLLDHPSARTQEYACLALIRLGPEAEAAVPALIRKVDLRDCPYRRDVILALKQIGPSASAAVPALISVLKDEDAVYRRAAAEALAGIGQAALPALIETLREHDLEARRGAFSAQQQLVARAAPAIPVLAEAAAEPNEGLRDAVFLTLAGIGGAAVDELVRLLDSPEAGLRRRAAMTLGQLRRAARQSETALGLRTRDADASVRFWAVRSLPAITAASAATREHVLQAVHDVDPNVRWQALTSLGALDAALAKQAAADLMNDPNPAVRKQAKAVAKALDGD